MEAKSFDWDKGNAEKNWLKHKVTDKECEEAFFDLGLLIYYDKVHSSNEDRYYALGSTFAGRRLFIVYTLRREKIRIISTRDMNKKEREKYEKRKGNTSFQE